MTAPVAVLVVIHMALLGCVLGLFAAFDHMKTLALRIDILTRRLNEKEKP